MAAATRRFSRPALENLPIGVEGKIPLSKRGTTGKRKKSKVVQEIRRPFGKEHVVHCRTLLVPRDQS